MSASVPLREHDARFALALKYFAWRIKDVFRVETKDDPRPRIVSVAAAKVTSAAVQSLDVVDVSYYITCFIPTLLTASQIDRIDVIEEVLAEGAKVVPPEKLFGVVFRVRLTEEFGTEEVGEYVEGYTDADTGSAEQHVILAGTNEDAILIADFMPPPKREAFGVVTVMSWVSDPD